MVMRRPTSRAEALAYHAAALAGGRPPKVEDWPECGWYRMRKVKGGPYIPVVIGLNQEVDPETGELLEPERLTCKVGGEPADPVKVWTFCWPITREAYAALLEERRGNRAMHRTDAPIDLTRSIARPHHGSP